MAAAAAVQLVASAGVAVGQPATASLAGSFEVTGDKRRGRHVNRLTRTEVRDVCSIAPNQQ